MRCFISVNPDPALLKLILPSRQLAISAQHPRTQSRTGMVTVRSVIRRFLEGDQSQRRDVKEPLNILWTLQRVVCLFLNKGSSRGTTKPQNQSYGQSEKDSRLDWRCGCL